MAAEVDFIVMVDEIVGGGLAWVDVEEFVRDGIVFGD